MPERTGRGLTQESEGAESLPFLGLGILIDATLTLGRGIGRGRLLRRHASNDGRGPYDLSAPSDHEADVTRAMYINNLNGSRQSMALKTDLDKRRPRVLVKNYLLIAGKRYIVPRSLGKHPQGPHVGC